MSEPEYYDVVVVGAGIEGSATAYSLVKDNYKTLLLDQFPLPHTRGSSHGHTRIIRKAYTQPFYVNMMLTAYEMWQQLEREENEQLYSKTGILFISETCSGYGDDIAKALRSLNSDFERLDLRAMKQRFPTIHVDDKYDALYDPDGGVLFADKVLASLWNQIKKHHGTIHDTEPVTSIIPGVPVVISTSKRHYKAGSVVLCLGPWTNELTRPLGLDLPLKPIRINVMYWKDPHDQYANMPCVTIKTKDHLFYGLPSFEYRQCVKFCCHSGPQVDPNQRDAASAIMASRDFDLAAKQQLSELLPGLEPKPSIQNACLYTMTPDENFIIDKHPKWENIVIGAGFSGHGFKLGLVVGMVLAQLATDREPFFDLSPFKASRFSNPAKL